MNKPSLEEIFQSTPQKSSDTTTSPTQSQSSKPSLEEIFGDASVPEESKPLPINTGTSSNSPRMMEMAKQTVKALSDPNAIASGTNYINAATQASVFVRQYGQEVLTNVMNLNKISNKPFNAAKDVGDMLPKSLPYAPVGPFAQSGQPTEMPFGEAISNISPQSIAKFAASELSDPINYATILGGLAKQPNPSKIIKEATSKLASKEIKLLDKTTKLIQPDIKQVAKSIDRGFVLPSIKEGSEIISKAKNYEELSGSFQQVLDKARTERDNILTHFNVPIDKNKVINSFDNFIEQNRKRNTKNPAFMKALDRAFYQELDELEKSPNFDIMSAQKRKEILQEETKPLLEKRQREGSLNHRESGEMQARDLARKAYRQSILESLPKEQRKAVYRLNQQMSGLIEAKKFIVNQAASSKLQPGLGVAERAVSGIGLSPQLAVGKAVARGIIQKVAFPKATSKIARLRQEVQTLNNIILSANKMNNPKGFYLGMQGFKINRKNQER